MPKEIAKGTQSVVKTKALTLSLAAIASAFIIEFSAGLLTNSLALLTDSIHSAFDIVVTAMLLVMTRLALKPRDTEHTYGHGKIETLGGFIGGIILFMVAIFFIHEAFVRIFVETPIVTPGIFGFFAAFYALAVAGFRIAILKHAHTMDGSSGTIKAGFYDAFADFGSTVVALIGIWLASTGIYIGDAAAAIVLVGMLLFLSSRLAYRTGMELTDAITPNMVSKGRDATLKTKGVMECRDVKMRRSGSDVFVELTVLLNGNINLEKAHAISADVERNVRNAIGAANVTVHFEPAYRDIPLESMIGEVSLGIEGVKGVHNISASKVPNGIVISLHVQVDRYLSLVDAHAIADRVEKALRSRIRNIRNVTVHLEPLLPDIRRGDQITDSTLERDVKRIALGHREIKSISNMITCRSDDMMKIDIHCVFGSNFTIDKVHDLVSEVEREIRTAFGNVVVTIHSEPEGNER